ncbi:MAG: short-chain dehydrogenase, partial [Gammaproteobacteria bacterium]
MDLQLAGKTVIVTGGGSNIGRAISHGFADEKANVVIADM